MVVLNQTKMVNFPADRSLADSAKQIMKEQNLSQTEVFNLFLKNIVVTGRINLLSEEELEKERLFKELQSEVKASIAEMEAGNYYTESQLREYLGI
ncbi:DNA-damage-inducible protein J [Streptococcus pseudoporcinus]|uniref:DNA-damage-inducible protein J n=1 Tax=Streptococcus pseudoporcinus TaxID=361101 RepID=A0A4U9YUZ5_9STRE|nr:XRE family transcriptional regulator [Streptococcus pseudoporcinus]VTS30354.1 DNA-damage-inducible protein J [Streptococcus pseudoporcinus]